MAQVQVKNVNWWHERLADWLIVNPHKTLKEASQYFSCSQSWISILKNSDSFQLYFKKRSEQYSQEVTSGVSEKMGAMTEMALDKLNEKLQLQGDAMPVETLLSIADTGLKRMGYSASKNSHAPVVNVGVTIAAVDRRALEEARAMVNSKFGVASNSTIPPSSPETSSETKLLEAPKNV